MKTIMRVIKKKVKKVKSIILYGSRARGDYGPASDYDFLIISDEIPENLDQRLDMEAEIGDELILKGIQVSILFLTQKELESSMNTSDPLMIEIYHNHKMIEDDGTFKKALKIIKPKLKNAIRIPEFKAWKLI